MLPDLPGWDSLSTVSRNHSIAEIAGIIILAALVVAEVASYKYGKRKDFLTEQQQHATDQRHDEEIARLHLEAAKANERAAETYAQFAARAIKPEQAMALISKLKSAGFKVRILFGPDTEAGAFAGKLYGIFREAEVSEGIQGADFTPWMTGITLSQGPKTQQLVDALKAADIQIERFLSWDQFPRSLSLAPGQMPTAPATDTILMHIGSKAVPPAPE
jgi:hypothetical protein